MDFEIKSYHPDYIDQQVELIWEVTGKWKYPYATSSEQIRNAYSAEDFDPSTRYYAFNGNNLVGYITSAVKEDEEKGKYATLRFPVVIDNNIEITDTLMEKALNRLEDLDAALIRAPAAEGLGNTMDLAERYGFNVKSDIFIRAKEEIGDLTVSDDTTGVVKYTDHDHHEIVKDIFSTKMGMPEQQGIRFHDWAINNKERKEDKDPAMTNWNLFIEAEEVLGFSYLFRSDRQPKNGQCPGIWTGDPSRTKEITDKLLSDHISTLGTLGLHNLGVYLNKNQYELQDVYKEFGFQFDTFYSTELAL